MVERGGLENRCTLARTEGSNPSPSAKILDNLCFSYYIYQRVTVLMVRKRVVVTTFCKQFYKHIFKHSRGKADALALPIPP